MTATAPNTPVACPLCTRPTDHLLTATLRRGTGRVLYCPDCDFGFLVKPPADLRAYYDGQYRQAHSHRAAGGSTHAEELFRIYGEFQQQRLAAVLPVLRPDHAVLEIGASAGQFLHHLAGKCRRRCAIELDRSCCVFMQETLGLETDSEFLERSRFRQDRFDVVCAFQVLEHSDDPIGLLREIAGVLAPGGHAFIEVPNLYDPLRAVWGIPEYETFYFHDAHLSYFTRRALTIAAKRAGLPPASLSFRFTQDYNLLNHLHWITTRSPQATCEPGLRPIALTGADRDLAAWLSAELVALNERYNQRLIESERTSNILMMVHRPEGGGPEKGGAA